MKQLVQVKVESTTIDWFDRNFPTHGARQTFVEQCFEALKSAVDRGEVMPTVNHGTLIVYKLAEGVTNGQG